MDTGRKFSRELKLEARITWYGGNPFHSLGECHSPAIADVA